MFDFWVHNKSFFIPMILGLAFIFLGIYKNYKIDTIRRDGIKTTAEIVDYIGEMSYTTEPIRELYYAVIRFTDSNGTGRQVIDRTYGTSIKPNKKLPYQLNINYIEKNGEFEVVTESKLNDIIAMGILIIGSIVTITTLFFHFYK